MRLGGLRSSQNCCLGLAGLKVFFGQRARGVKALGVWGLGFRVWGLGVLPNQSGGGHRL